MKSLLSISASALLVSSLFGATANASDRNLDIADAKTKMTEIRSGQIGPRDTLIFYTMADQAAVLQLNIKHDAGKFTLSGRVHLFPEATTAKSIGMWINNQHSCGLFPDVPRPTTSFALAADACTVLKSSIKKGGQVPRSPDGSKFEDHALKINVADVEGKGFKLKGFNADTSAYVKAGPTG